MRTVDIDHGGETVHVSVDAECEVLLPKEVPARDGNPIGGSLEDPIGASFEEFISGARDVLVIVNDGTRTTPTAEILDALIPLLDESEITFLIATGTHRGPTEDELIGIFGRHIDRFRDRIEVHDALDEGQLVRVGSTSRGTEVLLNRLAVDAERIITINSVEPHYFAGFSGGRKSILPGIAGYRTVEMNHSNAVKAGSAPAALVRNPVHEDMVEAVELLGTEKIYTLQLVLDSEKKVLSAHSGDINDAFEAAARDAMELQCVPASRKADIVVTCVPPPKDIDMYQSQHALENGKLALKEDGIIIWVSKCRNGVGNDAFLRFLHGIEDLDDVETSLAGGYHLGDHKALRIMQTLQWAEIWTVMGVEDDLISRAHMRPFGDIQSAIDEAIASMRSRGREPNVIVMPNGTWTVPVMEDLS